jgi:hypothetical protein
MTARLSVHVERVVLHGVPAMPPEALAAAIETALGDALSGRPEPPRGAPAARPPGADAQVARAVAPAVLSASGMGPPPARGGRP